MNIKRLRIKFGNCHFKYFILISLRLIFLSKIKIKAKNENYQIYTEYCKRCLKIDLLIKLLKLNKSKLKKNIILKL